MAFGAAALIYLIAEELLVESFQAEESLLSTAMLFAGFLVVLAVKLTYHH
jgi:ZIP family zinc transporter